MNDSSKAKTFTGDLHVNVVRPWWFSFVKAFKCFIALGSGKTICTLVIWGTKAFRKQKNKIYKKLDRIRKGSTGKQWWKRVVTVFTFFIAFLHFPNTLPCRLAVTLVPDAEIRLAKRKWIIYTGLPFRIKVSTMRFPPVWAKSDRAAQNYNKHRWTHTNMHEIDAKEVRFMTGNRIQAIWGSVEYLQREKI